jgi:hypothetical protein
MLRTVCVFVLLLFPLAAIAAPTPSPPPGGPAQAHDGGVIAGRVVSVDMVRSTLTIDAGSRGRLTVVMPPSVSVQGKDPGYHTVTDLRAGQRVNVRASIVGDEIVAQIITILS